MFINRNVLMESEPGAGGAGEDLNAIKAQLQEFQQTASDQNAELERLRAHSNKLLDEKKKLQDSFKAYEGLGDPKTLNNMLKQFNNDEDAKLVAEGKFADVLKKHTERMSLDFNSRIEELSKEVELRTKNENKYAELYHQSEAGHAVSAAAIKAGIRDTALDDALMRARGVFTVAEDGTLEARDSEGNLKLVDGKALTPELFVAQLRENYPHYWPESKSSGARGGAGGDNTPNPFVKGTKQYNLTAQAKLRKTNPELADRLMAEAKAIEDSA